MHIVPNLIVQSKIGDEMFILKNVCILDHILIQKVDFDIKKFDHLKDLPLDPKIKDVNILVGQDNSDALIPLEVVKGKPGEPFAVRTIKGWSLHGYVDE